MTEANFLPSGGRRAARTCQGEPEGETDGDEEGMMFLVEIAMTILIISLSCDSCRVLSGVNQ